MLGDKIEITLIYNNDDVQINLKGDSLMLYRFAKKLYDKADQDSITEATTPNMRLIKFTRTIISKGE